MHWYTLRSTGLKVTYAMKADMSKMCFDDKGRFKLIACIDWWFEVHSNFGYHILSPDVGVKSDGRFRYWDESKWRAISLLDIETDVIKLWPGMGNGWHNFWREFKARNPLTEVFSKENHTNKIYCKNTVLHLNDSKLTLHLQEPKNFNTYCLPVKYDPDATCPFWEELLNRCLGSYSDEDDTWTPDTELIAMFQEYIGYALQGGCNAEKFMILVGSGGNGKSILLKALNDYLFGDTSGYCALSRFGETDNGIADLVDKRLVYHPDEPGVSWKKLDNTIKNFTNGEPILATKKYIAGSYVEITAKGLWGMNDYPRFSDLGHGISRRLLVIPFNRQFTAKDGTDMTTSDIMDKLKDEGPGIFIWALKGLMRLVNSGWQFSKSTLVEEARVAAMSEHDTLGPWLEDNIEVTGNPKDYIPTALLAESYIEYCVENNVPEEFRKMTGKISSEITKRKPKTRRSLVDAGGGSGKRIRGVRGLRFKTVA